MTTPLALSCMVSVVITALTGLIYMGLASYKIINPLPLETIMNSTFVIGILWGTVISCIACVEDYTAGKNSAKDLTRSNIKSRDEWSDPLVKPVKPDKGKTEKRGLVETDRQATSHISEDSHCEVVNPHDQWRDPLVRPVKPDKIVPKGFVPYSEKPLVILGLTGVLCFYLREWEHQRYQKLFPTTKYYSVMDELYIYPRPGAFELLKYLIEEHRNIAIWSTLDETFVRRILCAIIMQKNFRSDQNRTKATEQLDLMFRFIWGREHCRPQNENEKLTKKSKYMMRIRDVLSNTKLNSDVSLSHSNIMLIEANQAKVQANPPNNIRLIPTFKSTEIYLKENEEKPLEKLVLQFKDKTLFENKKEVYSVFKIV